MVQDRVMYKFHVSIMGLLVWVDVNSDQIMFVWMLQQPTTINQRWWTNGSRLVEELSCWSRPEIDFSQI